MNRFTMPTDDDESIPIEACTLPGTITVTPPALGLAEQFQSAIPAGYVVVFSWYDWGRTRPNKDAPWVETGPGLDLGAYRVSQVPHAAIYQADSFRYAVLIRKEIVENHPQKTIDLDEDGAPILR